MTIGVKCQHTGLSTPLRRALKIRRFYEDYRKCKIRSNTPGSGFPKQNQNVYLLSCTLQRNQI